MTLKEITYLLTVARCTSISEASKQLYVAQPSLTHAIQSVEKEIGFRIFERSRSGVSVTERGEELLSDLQSVWEQMMLVQSKYVEKRPARKAFSVSIQHFSPAAAAFTRFLVGLNEPLYSAKLLEGSIGDVLADVASGRSEIGLLHFTEEKEPVVLKDLRTQRIELYSICESAPCLLFRQDHPLSQRASISQEDLSPFPLVSYDYEIDDAVCSAEEGLMMMQAQRRIIVGDGLAMLNVLSATDAYAVGLNMLPKLLAANRVTVHPLEDAKPLKLAWIKKTDTVLQTLTKQFLRELSPD